MFTLYIEFVCMMSVKTFLSEHVFLFSAENNKEDQVQNIEAGDN